MVFSTKKIRNIFWGRGSGTARPQILPPVGSGIPTPNPPWHLRHIDSSHSKILGTPLHTIVLPDYVKIKSCNERLQHDSHNVCVRW